MSVGSKGRLMLSLAVAACAGDANGQQVSDPHPILPEMAAFVRPLFEAIPAPAVAAAIEGASCKTVIFEDTKPDAGLEGCSIADVCPELTFPVWFDGKGGLGFGPDSAERLVAMHCPDQISDPVRRKELEDLVFQGG